MKRLFQRKGSEDKGEIVIRAVEKQVCIREADAFVTFSARRIMHFIFQ